MAEIHGATAQLLDEMGQSDRAASELQQDGVVVDTRSATLEDENTKLKRLVADAMLDNTAL